MSQSPPTVFISYAREDLRYALKLYNALKRAGAKPWLDKKALLPGQRWKVEVKRAIRESRYFLAVLSSNSVSKRGYIHKELAEALEILDEFPESEIFIIPARLDECSPSHEKLRDLHWVDMFPSWSDGFKKILHAVGVQPRGNGIPWNKVGIIVVVIGGLIALGAWLSLNAGDFLPAWLSKASTTFTPSPTPTPVPPTDTPPPSVPLGMIHISASEFTMGSDEGGNKEQPVHTVYLDAFYIDDTEVTNAQYQKCVEARACRAPTTCSWGEPTYGDASKADHPVVCVSWSDADAYCRWVGKRLPTEAEWEKAARGTDGRTYPWGEGIDCDHAQYYGCGEGTVPVGSKPKGASPYGAMDMAGNVWEWVADWYDEDYYNQSPARNPSGPDSDGVRVLRGGSWDVYQWGIRCSYRGGFSPRLRDNVVGFRCARGSQ